MSAITYTRLNYDLYNKIQQPAATSDKLMLQRASLLAQTSLCPKRVASIVVKNNRIVCQAVNQLKTHPQQKLWADKQNFNPRLQPYLHAELACIVQASMVDLNKSTIYVARIGNSGLNRCSYPCRICFPAVQHVGIKKIICFDTHCNPVSINL